MSNWEEDAKQHLMTGIGLVVLGVKALFDLEDYEIMVIVRDLMAGIEKPRDFFGGEVK